MKVLFSILLSCITVNLAVAQRPVSFVENSKYGLLGDDGSVVLEPIYDYLSTQITYADHNVLVRVADSCFLVNAKTKQTSRFSDQPTLAKQTLYPAIIAKGDKYGYIDAQGRVVIEGSWDFASQFDQGIARVVDGCGEILSPSHYPTSGRTGYIDTMGRYVIAPKYSYIDYFAAEVPVTRFTRGRYLCNDVLGCENPYKGSKWGLIDRSERIIVEDNKYDFIDRAIVDQKSGKLVFGVIYADQQGLIDATGKEIVPLAKYQSLQQMWKSYLGL